MTDGIRRGWGVSVTPLPLFTPGKDPVPIVQEAGWAPGPVWTISENLAPTGIRSPDCPVHSQLLYWLSYRAHSLVISVHKFYIRLPTNWTPKNGDLWQATNAATGTWQGLYVFCARIAQRWRIPPMTFKGQSCSHQTRTPLTAVSSH